jgi:hypothetical protein
MWRCVRLPVFPEISKGLNFFNFRAKHSKKNLQTLRELQARTTQHNTPEELEFQQRRHDIVAHTNQKFFSINTKPRFCNLRCLTSNTKSVHTSKTVFLFHVEIVCLHPTLCSTRTRKIF